MNAPRKTRCDQNRIRRFLGGGMEHAEEHDFVLHVDQCGACRERLRETAAEPLFWREAIDFLREDELDVEYTDSFVRESSETDKPAPSPEAIARVVIDSLAPSDDPRRLGRLGHYEIVGVIGFGGMGVVLKGFDAPLDRYVAIKILSPHLSSSGAARKRFAREAQAAAAVIHENVIAIHSVAEARGAPYLVMPYLSGPSLQKRLDEEGPLEAVEVLRIGRQIAAGLAAAHAQGLVHRDVKPANILLENGVERVLLTDFGLARAADDASLTHSGVIAGTPRFMSPEQARGEAVDCRSDLFSLGSVLYTMCIGRPPFRAETAYGVLRRISEESPRRIQEIAPAIPEWLCEIIEKLHAKEPGERFQSAGEVAHLLGRWLAHMQLPTTVPAPTRIQPTRGGTGSAMPKVVIASLALVAIGLGGLFAAVWRASPQAVTPQGSNTASTTARNSIDGGLLAHEKAADQKQTVLPVLPDDEQLYEAYSEVHSHASQLQRLWSEPAQAGHEESFDANLDELHRSVDELRREMDQDPF